MEMHLVPRHAMGLCLCVRQNIKDTIRCFFRPGRQIPRLDNCPDLRQSAVFMMVMPAVIMVVMAMEGLTLPVHLMIMHMHIPVQIHHIMVVVFLHLVETDCKITGIQPRLFHSGNMYIIPR